MKSKNTLLKQKQILCINDSIVEWIPAKDGEMVFGQSLIGVARDYSQLGTIIRNESGIKSVREATEEETQKFFAQRSRFDKTMADYYDKNSYTGD